MIMAEESKTHDCINGPDYERVDPRMGPIISWGRVIVDLRKVSEPRLQVLLKDGRIIRPKQAGDGLESRTVDELKALLAEKELDTTGKKADLIERLRAAH